MCDTKKRLGVVTNPRHLQVHKYIICKNKLILSTLKKIARVLIEHRSSLIQSNLVLVWYGLLWSGLVWSCLDPQEAGNCKEISE